MIKLILYTTATKKFDITNLVKDVTWSGDINTLGRQLDVSLQVATASGKEVVIDIEPGNMVIFYQNSEELFRGYIFNKTIDDKGAESLTCYDQLIYLSKNSDTIFIKNKSASDIIISTLKKYKIPVGKIEPTNFKIKKLLLSGKTLSDIFTESLLETKKSTRKSYKISSDKGKVNMVSREKASKKTISVSDIISGSRQISIDELKTQVKVEKGSFETTEKTTTDKQGTKSTKDDVKVTETVGASYRSFVASNPKLIAKFGIMQHLESVDDKTTIASMKKQAQTLLQQMSKPDTTISIDFIGQNDCITGNIIQVRDEITDIIGNYYITSDSHSWSGGSHKMGLQLSNKLE